MTGRGSRSILDRRGCDAPPVAWGGRNLAVARGSANLRPRAIAGLGSGAPGVPAPPSSAFFPLRYKPRFRADRLILLGLLRLAFFGRIFLPRGSSGRCDGTKENFLQSTSHERGRPKRKKWKKSGKRKPKTIMRSSCPATEESNGLGVWASLRERKRCCIAAARIFDGRMGSAAGSDPDRMVRRPEQNRR